MFRVSASDNPAADRIRLTTNMVAGVAAFAWRHARSSGDRSSIELARGPGADTLVHPVRLLVNRDRSVWFVNVHLGRRLRGNSLANTAFLSK